MEVFRRIGFTVLALVFCWACAPFKGEEVKRVIAIRHAAVVDVVNGNLLSDQTILLQGERILAVGPSSSTEAPRGATLIDARGKYVIPGLWDMHVHLDMAGAESLPLLLAHGVTGVRDMGSDHLDSLRSWGRGIEQGMRVGPHIITAGPMLDGPFVVDIFRVTVTDGKEARAAVDSLATLGVDFIKVHQQLSREAYFAAADQARRRGIAFVGHKPNAVSALEAVEAGQRSIEHIFGIPDSSHIPYPYIKEKGTWVTPTLILIDKITNHFSLSAGQDRRSESIPATLKDAWHKQIEAWGESVEKTVSMMQELKPTMMERTRQLHARKVDLLAGTDLGVPHVYPGSSLHEELGLLVEAGLSPLEAIRAATINPARFLKKDKEQGSVQAGKVADLVILDANPIEDISNTSKVFTVVFKGKVHGRIALDSFHGR